MSNVEFYTFTILSVSAFIATSAHAGYCSARFVVHRQGLRTLIPSAILLAWLIISAIGAAAVFVLLMAHSQRDTVLAMLRGIGIGYPILGIVFIFVLSTLNKRYIPGTKGQV